VESAFELARKENKHDSPRFAEQGSLSFRQSKVRVTRFPISRFGFEESDRRGQALLDAIERTWSELDGYVIVLPSIRRSCSGTS